jgi:hypothetical protein
MGAVLSDLAPASVEYQFSLATLDNIRPVLAAPGLQYVSPPQGQIFSSLGLKHDFQQLSGSR